MKLGEIEKKILRWNVGNSLPHIIFNDDGSALFTKDFFDHLLESTDLVDLTITIEKRGGQTNFLGCKLKRLHP